MACEHGAAETELVNKTIRASRQGVKAVEARLAVRVATEARAVAAVVVVEEAASDYTLRSSRT